MPSTRPALSIDEFQDLLEKARCGSMPAMGQLLQAHQENLLLLARWQIPQDLAPKEAPSDLVQDTLLSAHQDFPLFQGKSEHEFSMWLRQILHTTLLDFVRAFRNRHKRCAGREEPLDTHALRGQAAHCVSPEPTPSEVLIHEERLAALRGQMGELPVAYRNVLRMRHSQNLTFPEIGSSLGISEEAARKLCMRAERALGKLMHEQGISSA